MKSVDDVEAQADHRHRLRFAGWSREPHERCERPNRLQCVECAETVIVVCQRSSRAQCGPCGRRYHGRVRRIFCSGWRDDGQVLMLTLTAPGERQHAMPSGEVCACTPEGGVNLAGWNATAGQRWSWFMTYLRREFGQGIEFAKGVELQKRGAIHYHVMLRVPPGVATKMLRGMTTIRRDAIGRGFGHELRLEVVNGEGAAGYCAKYVSKSCDDRESFPWLDLRTGEILDGAPRFRPWSASRHWGSTMKQQRASEMQWALENNRDSGGAGDSRREPAPPLDSLPAIYTAKDEKGSKEAGNPSLSLPM